jgi:hypothetical protein
MPLTLTRRLFITLCLALLLAVSACGRQEQAPSRWEQAQQESATLQAGDIAAGEIVPGSALNTFFPRSAAEQVGFDFTYTQEKAGFAEAALAKEGTRVALLSISDTTGNPAAAEKYADSSRTIAGYPAYEADNLTAILVADRFQVQAFSQDDAFTAADRASFLSEFDLAGLAALE